MDIWPSHSTGTQGPLVTAVFPTDRPYEGGCYRLWHHAVIPQRHPEAPLPSRRISGSNLVRLRADGNILALILKPLDPGKDGIRCLLWADGEAFGYDPFGRHRGGRQYRLVRAYPFTWGRTRREIGVRQALLYLGIFLVMARPPACSATGPGDGRDGLP